MYKLPTCTCKNNHISTKLCTVSIFEHSVHKASLKRRGDHSKTKMKYIAISPRDNFDQVLH